MKRFATAPWLLLLFMNFSLFGAPRDEQWKRVQEAVSKGLPKTAITNLEPIIQGALRDRAYAEAVKAIAQKIVLEGNIEGNKPEERIVRLEAELAKAPREMVPMLDTILAHWYWDYYLENRWRFVQRTATASAPGKDFTTWDLPRLFSEIERRFDRALSAEAWLKSTPISAWNDLLVKGTLPDTYRPTLYDFIAQEALRFYTAPEQAGTRPEDAFELSADSPVLGPASGFLSWQPATTDTNAPAYKAVRLFQQLLRFHLGDPAPQLAFADADLERLVWAGNAAVGENKDARYRTALEAFISRHENIELVSLALLYEARLLQRENDLVGAHQLAERGDRAFPKSPGGRLCRNLLGEIEAKSAQIATERVWNCFEGSSRGEAGLPEGSNSCPAITVNYRNVGAVYFRAIPYDWELFLQKRYHRPENLSLAEQREVLAHTPALEWSEKLAPTTDYQQKVRELPAPTTLKPGFYFIAASYDPQFGEKENEVSLAEVWVTDIALVTRQREKMFEGFVLDANSGEPLAGAEIDVWHLAPTGDRIKDPSVTTDENGLFSFKSGQNRGYLLRARHHGCQLGTSDDLYFYPWSREESPRPSAHTVFFTDRALYRPGQMIQYKGICVWVDQDKDNYEVLKGEELTVVFRDSNGKEIARQKQQANDYGSFAGSFTAPRDRLMGAMSLQVEGRAQGAASVRVEEYKRPKFQTTLEVPKIAAKLNEKVSLMGRAMSYTGAAVDGAEVRYRIVRQVRMPPWWGWWSRIPRPGESQEIAHGSTRTAVDGTFHIEFTARPDLKVPEKDEPTFVFQVSADVTDSAGETRSAERNVRVGYAALEASLTANDWHAAGRPVELKVETKTLDDEPQIAEGRVSVYELQAPAQVQRAPLQRRRYPGLPSDESNESDQSDPRHWPLGRRVAERSFTTGTNGLATLSLELPPGAYRAMLETQDRFGKKVTARRPLEVLDTGATKLALKIPHLLAAPTWETQPGEEFTALWGTGYERGRAFVEIEHRHKMIQRYWTKPGQTQQQIKLAVTEAMRGGFTIRVTQVRANRAYLDSRQVQVPWKNKNLELTWEHFVSKLQPGQKETWTAVITAGTNSTNNAGTSTSADKNGTPAAEKAVAEIVATLYDESLDAFAPHPWTEHFDFFHEDTSFLQAQYANFPQMFQHVFGQWARPYARVEMTYRSFPPELVGYRMRFGGLRGRSVEREEAVAAFNAPAKSADLTMAPAPEAAAAGAVPMNMAAGGYALAGESGGPAPTPQPDLSQVAARQNLDETAFFYPQLTSDSNGVVRMTFTMPEALTKWRFMGFAHDRKLRSGYLEAHAVTAKDLMVQPNPPRFLREGDTVEFTVKVSNQSDRLQTGTVRLTFTDLSGGEAGSPADVALGNTKPDQPFSVPAKESRSFSWRITVPDGCGFLSYKAVAAAVGVSDGEEGAIPVLSRRVLVTESLPLPIRGPATRKFEFTRLLKSGGSKTLRNQSLTVQMVSNPAWYAVLALPYLMEYPYECSEQVFNRYYANSLAWFIANRDPKIQRIFEQWRNTPALDSPLEKNPELKSVALEETPWLRQGQAESQARRNIGILFDNNRLEYERGRTLRKLAEMQLPDGSWPWFPGGEGNDYITLYITTGFGRLRHLGVAVDISPAVRSLRRLDAWLAEQYERIQQRPEPEKYIPSATDALYLYGRSFFLKDQPIAASQQKVIAFYLAQARKFWLQTDCRQTQAQLALALLRFNALNSFNDTTPASIMASLKERSVSTEEMGMYWRDTELSWWWYRAPIETQALMIEAFDEVAHDAKAVEDCKVWLLKQKQTQDWRTTKATADAIYALLLRGADLLSSEALVDVKLDGFDITPSASSKNEKSKIKNATIEPGTGFYEVRFTPAEIKPRMGEITVKKTDPGVAWGSVHWQYLEDLRKVTPYAGTPLKLKKTLFVKTATSRGPVLAPVSGLLQVGDELVVRIELRVDRDMEFVHLKDERGSGTEPVNVLSRYRFQDGLAYYESTRDTASHFFIDYLPKGTYVFEYSTRIQLRGRYQTGVAEIQCLYAPEFNSHSEGFELEVK